MYAVGYSIAGLNLGYAFYDSDELQVLRKLSTGVGTSMMGMYLGAQFASHDTTGNDTDYMTLSIDQKHGSCIVLI